MLKPIEPGSENFAEYINNNLFYIDKTSFIKTVFKPGQGKVLFITRPRRFGKTLTMSTFYEFLRINPKDPNNIDDTSYQERLFKDTKIFEDKEFCSEYMGKYPVIFITLKEIHGNSFQLAFEKLGELINNLITNNFKYLFSSDKLSPDQKRTLLKISDSEYFSKGRYSTSIYEIVYSLDSDSKTTIQKNLESSLKFLTTCLSTHHGVNPIVLIDEYDTPLSKALTYGYYDEMMSLMSRLLGNLLISNPYLGKAVLTGCLRAAKESLFLEYKNFAINTLLDDSSLSEGIGFTENEVSQVLEYYALNDYNKIVKEYYYGYYFGYRAMYCHGM